MERTVVRCALYALGVSISSVCYGWTVRSELGLGPYFLLQEALERHLSWSPGVAAAVLGVFFLGLVAVLRGGVGPGTLVAPPLGGLVIDLTLPVLPILHAPAARVAVCTAATVVMMLGAAMVHRARVGSNPLDGIMHSLSLRSGVAPGRCRMVMESTMVVLGWLLGSTVGVGTVIAAVLVGHSFQLWSKVLDVIVSTTRSARRHVLERRGEPGGDLGDDRIGSVAQDQLAPPRRWSP